MEIKKEKEREREKIRSTLDYALTNNAREHSLIFNLNEFP